MKHFLLFILLLNLIYLKGIAQCTSCTITISTNSNQNISVTGNTRLCITGGTFTGTISGPNGANASVCVGTNATFNPSNLNNWNGTITNYGTANLPSSNMNGGATLDNYGTATVAGVSMVGQAEIIVQPNGTLIINGSVSLPNNGEIDNNGNLTINQNLDISGTFANDGRLTVKGALNLNSSLTNNSRLRVNGDFNINSGSNFTNNCVLVCDRAFNNSSSNTVNNGFIWQLGIGTTNFNLNSNFSQGSGAEVRAFNFVNSAQVRGRGRYFVTNTSTNNNSFGADGLGINFFDASLSNPARFFDNQGTNPHSSVTKNAFTPSDTTTWAANGTGDAGTDRTVCINQASLAAVSPTTGMWSLVSGNATIENPTNRNTNVTNLGNGANVLRWRGELTCGSASDNVTVTFENNPSQTTWTGSIDTDWHKHPNWTNCIPNTNTITTIANTTRKPIISGNRIGLSKKVTVQTGANVQVQTGSQLRVNE